MDNFPLLLLHGALGTHEQFDKLTQACINEFDFHRLTFEGHGDQAPVHAQFRIEHFVANVIAYLDDHALSQVDIFGYSMGGYVALTLAATHPDRVRRVFTLGTELVWTPARTDRDVKMLDADKIAAKVPAFAQTLELRHPAYGWRNVLGATVEMLYDLGTTPRLTEMQFRALPHRVRLGVGDQDVTAGVEDTLEVFPWLKNGELQVFPATPHPFERVDVEMLAGAIRQFFSG
ncbi:MAG: alpha/beta fold hydrolase [Anaerolineales bacterium]|nr:alpha/beta fold hydrolase [Anaerolineales bacterium]